MPAFCRVAATLTPTSDSEIGIEVWMPAVDLERKFEGVGNGGFAVIDPYADLRLASRSGTPPPALTRATLDTRPTMDPLRLDIPEKIIDFGYRSIHLMTVIGKRIIICLLRRESASVPISPDAQPADDRR